MFKSAIFCIAVNITWLSVTPAPSSLNANAPTDFKALKSTTAAPFRSRVTGAYCLIFTEPFVFKSSWLVNRFGVSGVGFKLAMAPIVVNPPCAAAALPVLIVSLLVNPGSRRCTWTSIRPGVTSACCKSITWSAEVTELFKSVMC